MKLDNFKKLVEEAEHILVIQPENPDGDSLSSALALEEILTELGKKVSLFCKVIMPRHLRHLPGWDRVSEDLPTSADLSIIVDTTAVSLLEKMLSLPEAVSIKQKPIFIIDHHDVETEIDFATELLLDRTAVATGEVIFDISNSVGWKLTLQAREFLASSIMYDSLGLTSDATTPKSIRIIADLVEGGVSLANLDSKRRASYAKPLELVHFKGDLLQRVETILAGQIALIHVTWNDIHNFSDQYNPSMLVLDDMRLIEGVKYAIALKTYPDGKITGKLRANYGFPIAGKVAENFGGGGHEYSSGFKVTDMSLEEVRTKLIQVTQEVIDEAV